jgi:hypothetical protein
MFETPRIEEQQQSQCQLTFVTFPWAFQDLGNLEEKDQILGDFIAQLKKGDKVGEYLLRNGILYDRSSKRRDYKIVVPTVAGAMIFQYFHESTLG